MEMKGEIKTVILEISTSLFPIPQPFSLNTYVINNIISQYAFRTLDNGLVIELFYLSRELAENNSNYVNLSNGEFTGEDRECLMPLTLKD